MNAVCLIEDPFMKLISQSAMSIGDCAPHMLCSILKLHIKGEGYLSFMSLVWSIAGYGSKLLDW